MGHVVEACRKSPHDYRGQGYVPGWFYTSRARRHAMLLHTTHQGYMISLVFEGDVSCALGADMGALGCVVGVGGSVSTIRWLVVGLGGRVQDVTILLHNLVKRDLIKRATEHQTPSVEFQFTFHIWMHFVETPAGGHHRS